MNMSELVSSLFHKKSVLLITIVLPLTVFCVPSSKPRWTGRRLRSVKREKVKYESKT